MLNFQFSTDTAELAIFDPERLLHRKDEAGDWWTLQRENLLELNAGNLLSRDLGADGLYSVDVEKIAGGQISSTSIKANLNVGSGSIFIGAGEDITGGELEPDERFGGRYESLEPGWYNIREARGGTSKVLIAVTGLVEPAPNKFEKILRVTGSKMQNN